MSFFTKLLQRFRKPRAGIASVPGESVTMSAGRVPRLPVIDWEKLYRKSFLYNSLASVICGYFAAELLVAGMTPYFPPNEAPRAKAVANTQLAFAGYSTMIVPTRRKNLFNKDGLVPNNDAGGGGPQSGDPVKTQLPLTLLGVIVVSDPAKSVASVEDKGANQVIAVRVGENISSNATVDSITQHQVIFFNQDTNRMEFVELPLEGKMLTVAAKPLGKADAATGIRSDGAGNYAVPRKFLETQLGEKFGELLTQARCIQQMQNGKPAGYQCVEIEPGSLYDKLGLKNGDVVTSIEGEPLDNIQALISKLERLKSGSVSSMSMTLTRGGKTEQIQVSLE